MAGGTLHNGLQLATTNNGIDKGTSVKEASITGITLIGNCNKLPFAVVELLQWHTHLSSFFSFKSCEPCCFIYHFVDVACKLSRFCEMVCRPKSVGPHWAIHLAYFL